VPQMSAAPAPIELGGVTYRMSPLDDADYDELTNWLKSEIINTARCAITSDMSDDERREIMAAAMAEAAPIRFGELNSKPYLKSIYAFSRMIWQGLIKLHPRVQLADVRAALAGHAVAIQEASRVFMEINSQKHRGAGEDAGQEPRGPRADQGRSVPATGEAVPLHARGHSPNDALPAVPTAYP